MQYDTIIIDEAMERSLNIIDFCSAIWKELLPRRPDLKVIITFCDFVDPNASRATLITRRLSKSLAERVSRRSSLSPLSWKSFILTLERDQLQAISTLLMNWGVKVPAIF